jgi:hypothetical protein
MDAELYAARVGRYISERDAARAERDAAVAAVRGLVDNYAAHDQQAFEAAHEAAIAVLAGGSAPHQGATTDGPTWDAYRAADRALSKWHERRHALLARLAAIESNDRSRRVFSGYLPSTIFTAEVRALLGAGETTEADQ